MTHRGPFQPLLFCDSVILCCASGQGWGGTASALLPLSLTCFHYQHAAVSRLTLCPPLGMAEEEIGLSKYYPVSL